MSEEPDGVLPRLSSGALGGARIAWGFVTALTAGPALTLLLLSMRNPESITYEVLAFQLLVVIVALAGGMLPAVLTAVMSGVVIDVLFVAPQFSITVEHPFHAIAVALYVIVGVLVSIIVDNTARRARAAERAAAQARELADTDQVRTALLSAVSHDVRRPLAAAIAAIGGLRAAHDLSPDDRDALLETAEQSLAALTRLITDLLDVSRAEAGALAVSLAPTDAHSAVLAALEELSLGPDDVELDLDADLGPLEADPVLLQRVLVNLLANALRFSPAGVPVRIATSADGAGAGIRIIDRGVGIDSDRHESVFRPFQRLGDSDNTAGLGLGLALSRGFAEGMGGSLTPEQTPGGGLTMCVRLPLAATTERSGA